MGAVLLRSLWELNDKWANADSALAPCPTTHADEQGLAGNMDKEKQSMPLGGGIVGQLFLL